MPKQTTEQRLAQLEQAMTSLANAVERHEKLLKGGDDGQAGIIERIRRIETSIDSASTWLRAIVMLFLAQFVAVIFSAVQLFVKVLPILAEMAK